MQVNLRKANALAKSLQDEALKQNAPHAVTFSIYAESPDIKAELASAGEALRTALSDALALTAASYAIRGLLGKAFHTSGINDVLTEKALLDRQEKMISAVFAHAPRLSHDVDLAPRRLQALIDQHSAAQAAGTRCVAADSLNLSVQAESYAGLEDQLRDIRRRKTEITDELLGLNTAHRITLPEDVVALIERFKLN